MSSDIAATDRRAPGQPKLHISRRLVIQIALFAAFAVAVSYGYAKFGNSAKEAAISGKGPGRGQPTRVAAATIAKGDLPVILTGLGTVTPSATAVVKTRISGHLVGVDFTEAQYVKAGDVLANVDPRPYQLALAQAEGQLQKDLALLQNAERDLGRYESLIRRMKDVISAQQVDGQRALINQYKGTVAIDRALVEQARLNLAYCKIVSPIDGRVGLRQVDQGNYVQPGDANGVAVVTKLSPITVVFTLPESQIPTVLKRSRAGEKLTVVAYDHERSIELARGYLIAVDNQIDAASGTVKLRAQFANEDERLFPNQFVNADLQIETLRDVAIAPSAAIQQGAKGPFVYAILTDSTVRARSVKLGPAQGEKVVVNEGLAIGDKVVVEGADRLREGATVTLPSAEEEPRGSGRRATGKNDPT
ncbi:MdtA/MuxA family multidrug efflux RND transporter periplasmic adaptor subunit [Methylocystis parvus]|uniref:MdtA/MuxA family multidrug efflux RND transporter periplasmic adaptor subunit n=1 Tax=Methylocystis parvus TaxID=134 RepID=A0A6B8M0U5_9HYPH|nr:MdtA/MuxA family multidrug efflux RND transporter periplasmic adaptor subunit [Methylocystis parvus]QGM97404.1 MdtA/MuxA family multidrug efflux RND transporter periplasmic adaptor subunit [Methylocystis parvus]WBJ98683.1 MdtA/MuxA family multidrug efflux RND transporter periplasmic adaptor subunit [Methylocystis parvus OBBP]